jgi:hypothetical protein
MREVPVVTSRNAEHTDEVECDAEQRGIPGHAGPKRGGARGMDAKERKAPDPVDALAFGDWVVAGTLHGDRT